MNKSQTLKEAKKVLLTEIKSIKTLSRSINENFYNVVLSRKAVLQEVNSEEREKLLATLAEGQILKGIVKKGVLEVGKQLDNVDVVQIFVKTDFLQGMRYV